MTTAEAATATATAAAATRVRRAWKLRPLPKRVANTPDGMDQPRLAVRLELAAKVRHIDLQGIGAGAEVIAPHLLEDARAGEHHSRVAHEQLQQAELGPGQLQLPLAAAHLHRLAAEDDVPD